LSVFAAPGAYDRAITVFSPDGRLFQVEYAMELVNRGAVGLSSDARVLIDNARIYAQSNRLMYDEPIDVEVITKRIGDIKQLYTQHAGVRPFGVSIIFGGVDKTGNKIFATHASGAYRGYKATALGAGRETVIKILKEEYRENMTLEEAIKLTIKCLTSALEARGLPPRIKIAVVPAATKKLRMLTEEEIEEYRKSL